MIKITSTLVHTVYYFALDRSCMMMACGLPRFVQPAAFSIVLAVQSVELVKTWVEEAGEGPIPLKAVCNSSWPNPTPPQPGNQWWCSNLTDWAQRFVCLKPLTYFYSHCRSQSLYGMIAELIPLVYSNSSLEKKEVWVKWKRLFKCLLCYTYSLLNWKYSVVYLFTKKLNYSRYQTGAIYFINHQAVSCEQDTHNQWDKPKQCVAIK